MTIDYVPLLADAMREYYQAEELLELCRLFDVSTNIPSGSPFHFGLSTQLLARIEHGNNHRLLVTLVDRLLSRALGVAERISWETRHNDMIDQLQKLRTALDRGGLPEELMVPEDRPFEAKSEIREFLGGAETPLILVDNYVGPGTLDCLRDVNQPIRILTGAHNQAFAPGFDRAVKEFITEGRTINVRQHPKLHDRYILFNERSWLVGSSLKDAGKKAFNLIEIVDGHEAISQEVERKWNEASDYQP